MTPYYDQDGITIYHGDAREVLPQLEPVDLVLTPPHRMVTITDPPYGIVNKFSDQKRGNKGVRALSFSCDSDGIVQCVGEVIELSLAVCTKPGAALCFVGLDTVAAVQGAMRAAGFTPKPFAWVKKYPAPAMKGNWWPSGFELGIYGYQSGAYFSEDDPRRSNVFLSDSLRFGQPDKNGHPTQKPTGLMRRFVLAMTCPGDTILDPFMGSGTTLRAAKDLGRRAIGIEIEEKYVQIAIERLRQGVLFT